MTHQEKAEMVQALFQAMREGDQGALRALVDLAEEWRLHSRMRRLLRRWLTKRGHWHWGLAGDWYGLQMYHGLLDTDERRRLSGRK